MDPSAVSTRLDSTRCFTDIEQVVLVFQGGGALGAYQAGVYQALHEAGIEPDWVIGTSIGAINAALIAGNPIERRMQALNQFWDRVSHQEMLPRWPGLQWPPPSLEYLRTVMTGIPGFFEPRALAFLGAHVPLGADAAGYYSTAPLFETLTDLVDFTLIETGRTRLTVGAASVCTSEMHYFDNRKTRLGAEHVIASGALPPAFPAIRIDGELYWDGGILSNSPTEVIFDHDDRVSSLVFSVHLWNPDGPEPTSIWEVLHRQKDIQYSSRISNQIMRQRELHRLRHVISSLGELLPASLRDSKEVSELLDYGCLTRMHVVRLLAAGFEQEDQTKDVDFSRRGIRGRWQQGYEAARQAIADAPWKKACDPLEGVVLHEPGADGRYMPSRAANGTPTSAEQPIPANAR